MQTIRQQALIKHDALLDAVRLHTKRPANYEHTGGGMIYVYAELDDEHSYTWLGWTDRDDFDVALADLSIVDDALIVAGYIYTVSDNSVDPVAGVVEDERVGPDGLIAAVLRFIDRASAALVDESTEWIR